MGRSSRRMERDGISVEQFNAMVSASVKIFFCYEKKFVILAQPFLMPF